MANRMRLMVAGRPKSGKTGSLVSLAEAGFELGILDFDGNSDPLWAFASPEAQSRISVLTFQDGMRLGSGLSGGKEFVQIADEPMALRKGFAALDNWSKFDEAHPWGPVKTWGTNRILVLDNLTSMGEAAFDRIRYINGRNRGNTRDSDWGLAMDDQGNMLKVLMSSKFNCHVLCLAHLKLILPKEPRTQGDTEELIDIKMAIAKANADLQQPRLYPHCLGRALPEVIMKNVPGCVMIDLHNNERTIFTRPQKDVPFDIGVPAKAVKEFLPLETGMLTLMKAITGHDKPY